MNFAQVSIRFATTLSLCLFATSTSAANVESVQIGDHKVEFVQEGGAGRPVVFVHGAMSDMHAWDAFPELISDEFNVIAFTQRYFGDQPWPDDGSGFQITTLFDDLIAFVEVLDVGKVDLVTWSLGGEVGINATMMRPDLFRSAVHFEPVSTLDMSGVENYAAANEELGAKFGPAFEALGNGQEIDAGLLFIEGVFDLPEGEAKKFPAATVDMWKRNARTMVPNFLTSDDPPPISCADLDEVQTPTLIVMGDQTYKDFELLASEHTRCLGNAKLDVINGVNHNGPLAAPEKLSELIMDFLRAN